MCYEDKYNTSGAFVHVGDHIINKYDVSRIEKTKHAVTVYMKSGDSVCVTGTDAAIAWTAFKGL